MCARGERAGDVDDEHDELGRLRDENEALRRENEELHRALVMVRDLATTAGSIGGEEHPPGISGECLVGLERRSDRGDGAGGDVSQVS